MHGNWGGKHMFIKAYLKYKKGYFHNSRNNLKDLKTTKFDNKVNTHNAALRSYSFINIWDLTSI